MKKQRHAIRLLLLAASVSGIWPVLAQDGQVDADDRRQSRQDKADYVQLIDRLENTQGLFTPALEQALLDLGQIQHGLEDFDDAAATFEKALQLKRMNNGLNDPGQLPILQKLVSSQEANEDWASVDANLQLYFHIAVHSYPPGDSRRLFALEQLTYWKVRNALNRLTPGYTGSAVEATALFKGEIQQLNKADPYPGKSTHEAFLLLRKAETNLNLAMLALDAPLRDFDTGTSRTTTERRCSAVPQANGEFSWVCNDVSVPNINFFLTPALRKNQSIGSNLLEGKKNILRAYEKLQDDTPLIEERNQLLMLMQTLTEDYNRFVTGN